MSLNNAIKALKNTEKLEGNATATVTHLPTNILEAFIPGYSIIAQFFLDFVGIDVTLIVSVCLLLFGVTTSVKFIWTHAYQQFERYCMSSILIESGDDIYEQIMHWIATQKVSKKSRKLTATTKNEDAWDLVDEDIEEVDPEVLINFSQMDAKVAPKFQPSFGTHYFLHRGNLFAFKRGQKQLMSSGWGGSLIRDEEDITLTCVGRSTQPLKDLIAEARQHFYKKEKPCTSVRRPAVKEMRNRGRYWTKVATRPSRPVHTVVLDHEQKNQVLDDINEYLHPATKFWYAHRGIPYRRGYLFHGPPGTGKSSLAWAIAGVFGLDIYCISLVDPTLTEEDLSMMFTSLPRRCVVLLEDIDSAGLSNRQGEAQAAEAQTKDAASNDAARIGAEITKAFESVKKSNDKNNDKKGITLSGLLNAIDGVASHEGRVLVMTTNFPENLDDALIRPGRIDMKVQFTNATRTQIYELFTRMYSPNTDPTEVAKMERGVIKLETVPKKQQPACPSGPVTTQSLAEAPLLGGPPGLNPLKANDLTPPATPKRAASPSTTSSPSLSPSSKLTIPSASDSISTSGDIEAIASRFAERLPEGVFTPAEIQGFLLTRKKEPLRALQEIEAWKADTIKAKEKKASANASSVGGGAAASTGAVKDFEK